MIEKPKSSVAAGPPHVRSGARAADLESLGDEHHQVRGMQVAKAVDGVKDPVISTPKAAEIQREVTGLRVINASRVHETKASAEAGRPQRLVRFRNEQIDRRVSTCLAAEPLHRVARVGDEEVDHAPPVSRRFPRRHRPWRHCPW